MCLLAVLAVSQTLLFGLNCLSLVLRDRVFGVLRQSRSCESHKGASEDFDAMARGVLIAVISYLNLVASGNEEALLSNDFAAGADSKSDWMATSDSVFLTSCGSDAESSGTSNVMPSDCVDAVISGWSVVVKASYIMDVDGSLAVSWTAQDSVLLSNDAEDTLARELRGGVASTHVLYSTNAEEERSPSINISAGFGNRGTNDVLSVDIESPAVRPGSPAREGAGHE